MDEATKLEFDTPAPHSVAFLNLLPGVQGVGGVTPGLKCKYDPIYRPICAELEVSVRTKVSVVRTFNIQSTTGTVTSLFIRNAVHAVRPQCKP